MVVTRGGRTVSLGLLLPVTVKPGGVDVADAEVVVVVGELPSAAALPAGASEGVIGTVILLLRLLEGVIVLVQTGVPAVLPLSLKEAAADPVDAADTESTAVVLDEPVRVLTGLPLWERVPLVVEVSEPLDTGDPVPLLLFDGEMRVLVRLAVLGRVCEAVPDAVRVPVVALLLWLWLRVGVRVPLEEPVLEKVGVVEPVAELECVLELEWLRDGVADGVWLPVPVRLGVPVCVPEGDAV